MVYLQRKLFDGFIGWIYRMDLSDGFIGWVLQRKLSRLVLAEKVIQMYLVKWFYPMALSRCIYPDVFIQMYLSRCIWSSGFIQWLYPDVFGQVVLSNGFIGWVLAEKGCLCPASPVPSIPDFYTGHLIRTFITDLRSFSVTCPPRRMYGVSISRNGWGIALWVGHWIMGEATI